MLLEIKSSFHWLKLVFLSVLNAQKFKTYVAKKKKKNHLFTFSSQLKMLVDSFRFFIMSNTTVLLNQTGRLIFFHQICQISGSEHFISPTGDDTAEISINKIDLTSVSVHVCKNKSPQCACASTAVLLIPAAVYSWTCLPWLSDSPKRRADSLTKS